MAAAGIMSNGNLPLKADGALSQSCYSKHRISLWEEQKLQTSLKQIGRSAWVRALVLLACGVWFMIAPYSVYHIVKWVLVIGLLAMAIPSLIRGIRDRNAGSGFNPAFGAGLTWLIAALLVWALFRPALSVLPVVFGILLIIYGINRLANSRSAFVNVSPVPNIIYGVVVVLAGIFLLFNPFGTILLTLQVLGFWFVVMGVMEIVTALRGH